VFNSPRAEVLFVPDPLPRQRSAFATHWKCSMVSDEIPQCNRDTRDPLQAVEENCELLSPHPWWCAATPPLTAARADTQR
jgi:hypothetical protein